MLHCMVIAAMLAVVCFDAYAQAVNAIPASWDDLRKLIPVVLVALLGGVVSFIGKVKAGHSRAFNITEFVGEMVTSAVVGVFFYWLCRGFDLNQWLTAAIVGMAGHAGSRGLFMLEKWAQKKLDGAG